MIVGLVCMCVWGEGGGWSWRTWTFGQGVQHFVLVFVLLNTNNHTCLPDCFQLALAAL